MTYFRVTLVFVVVALFLSGCARQVDYLQVAKQLTHTRWIGNGIGYEISWSDRFGGSLPPGEWRERYRQEMGDCVSELEKVLGRLQATDSPDKHIAELQLIECMVEKGWRYDVGLVVST